MPKLFKTEYERKIYAFRRWFKGKRAMFGVSQDDLAKELGITQAAVSSKIQPKGERQTSITYKDLLIFFKLVKATDEEILHYMKL